VVFWFANMSPNKTPTLTEGASLAVVLGAVGSLALMLYAFRFNPSKGLLILFVFWVSAPFVLTWIVNRIAQRWSWFPHTVLHKIMLLLAVVTPAIYLIHLLRPLSPKGGFPFIVVPPISGLVVVSVMSVAVLKMRSRSPGEP